MSSLAGVVLRTGEAVAEVVDREGGLRESLGGDNVTQVRGWRGGRHVWREGYMARGRLMPCNDDLPPVEVVSDSVQSLLLLVPQIKANISQAIGMVPQVGRALTLLIKESCKTKLFDSRNCKRSILWDSK